MIKQQYLRNVMIILGLIVSGLNIYLLTMPTTQVVEHLYPTNNNHNNNDNNNNKPLVVVNNHAQVQIGADFFQSHKVVEESKLQIPQSYGNYYYNNYNNNNNQKTKVLVGIFSSADSVDELTNRNRHRQLFQIWNDPRVCTLHDYQIAIKPNIRNECQLIYTFIMGGADPMDKSAPTELLSNTTERPIERKKPIVALSQHASDCNDDDVTLLNIRENINDGKSPTFFYWASLIMDQYEHTNNNNNNNGGAPPIHYAMKLNADTILHLHDFLLFCDTQLPPPPFYSKLITVGALRNKAPWPKHDTVDLPRFDSYWGNQFEGVHLYLAGSQQAYMLSKDLCEWISQEAPFSKVRIMAGGYVEGQEDHDISAMVVHHAEAIHMISIGKSQRFWEHPGVVKMSQPRWERIVKRETARMNKEAFEGKELRVY